MRDDKTISTSRRVLKRSSEWIALKCLHSVYNYVDINFGSSVWCKCSCGLMPIICILFNAMQCVTKQCEDLHHFCHFFCRELFLVKMNRCSLIFKPAVSKFQWMQESLFGDRSPNSTPLLDSVKRKKVVTSIPEHIKVNLSFARIVYLVTPLFSNTHISVTNFPLNVLFVTTEAILARHS